jgi:hypothetical protein
MSEQTPITPEDPDVPAEPPSGLESPDPEIHDQPLGVPADADPADAPAPGLPQTEPPAAS